MNALRASIAAATIAATLALQSHVWAVNPAVWTISEATTGQDVFWTSPTAVDLGFPRYATTFDFTRVEVFSALGGSDVTDQLADTEGTEAFDDLPITFIDEVFAEPTTGTSATVNIGIDANGFGQIAITDIVLGTIIVFPITRIEVDANLSVRGIVPGDFDGNLVVDDLDLARWEIAYGVNVDADTNFDGQSDGLDFLEWQRFLGADYSPVVTTLTAVPEPGSGLIALLVAVSGAWRSAKSP